MGDFVTRNKPDWDELEELLERAKNSVRQLDPEEVNRLDVLYRRVTIHLAQVRTRTRDERLAVYLNSLAAAAHSVIYLPPRKSVFGKIGAFAAYGFAQTIARNWRYHLASAALIIVGASWPITLAGTTCLRPMRCCNRATRVNRDPPPSNCSKFSDRAAHPATASNRSWRLFCSPTICASA